MSTEVIIAIVASVIGSGGITAFAVALMNKKKIDAEARSLGIEADANVGTSWREYALQMKKDMEGFREELNRTNILVAELKGTLVEKDKHIASLTQILQNRNPDLVSTLQEIRDFMKALHNTSKENTEELHSQTRMMKQKKTDEEEIDISELS